VPHGTIVVSGDEDVQPTIGLKHVITHTPLLVELVEKVEMVELVEGIIIYQDLY
jgi:hypothetical protein